MKTKTLAIVLAIALIIGLVGCESTPNDANGMLLVRICGDAKAKGISPIDMNVDHYSINLTSEGKDSIKQDGITSGYAAFNVPPATWDIVVRAHNRDGIAIGEGCGSCSVMARITSECEILVEEYTGKGNLNLVAEISGEGVARIEIANANDNVVASKDLASGSNIFQLDSGFYLLKIADGSGETLYMETFRICAGHDTNATVSVSTNGDGAIRITNGIQNTPDIVISMKSILTFGEEFTVETQIENLPEPVYKWYFDNVLVEGADSSVYASSIPAEDGIAEGTHTITCVVSSGDIVWSASEQFSVLENTFEGTWWVASKPEANSEEHFKIDMHCGHMIFDRYSHCQAGLGLESDYTATKTGNDYRIDFHWYNAACHFIIHDGDLGNAELFYSPDDNYGTAMTFEEFVSEPEWTEGYAERDGEYHVRTISNPELGTFEIDGDHFRHRFEDGICVQCGYDSNKHLYEVNSDLSVVDENVDYISEVCRYWPNHLTLHNGVVVEDSNGFYIKKEGCSMGNRNRYILYVPHTIVDFYVRNGGGGGEGLQRNAMEWYVEQVLGRKYNFWNWDSYNEMLKKLFANGNQIASLDASTIKKPDKMIVSNDVSGLEHFDDKDHLWIDSFTLNDVKFEDGSPVTEADAFYFSVLDDNRVKLYVPDVIQQEYEKGKGAEFEGGSFWWYFETYYPEIRDGWTIGNLKLLLSEEFRKPSYEDVP